MVLVHVILILDLLSLVAWWAYNEGRWNVTWYISKINKLVNINDKYEIYITDLDCSKYNSGKWTETDYFTFM